MKVPLLDLTAQYQSIRAEIDAAVSEVMASQHFILGPKVVACEESIAAYCGSQHAIGLSSGTDALLIALMAEDIGSGDEVITTPYSFFATGGCIARVGATPVFVDIDPASFNIAISQIEKKITQKTRAIIPVHLYGQMAEMDGVMEIAKCHNLIVIEDAAQALGAESGTGKAGSIGHYGCFSFFPSKNLGAAGDGGMIVTQDAERDDKLRRLRAHGSKPKYYHSLIGGNFRLDALQAAVVSVKLPSLDGWIEARRKNATTYRSLFKRTDLVEKGIVVLPEEVCGRHTYNQFVIRVKQRDTLRSYLSEQNIGSEIYYPVPLHLQKCFSNIGHRPGGFPQSEEAASTTLAVPVYPELTDEQIQYVVTSIEGFYLDQ